MRKIKGHDFLLCLLHLFVCKIKERVVFSILLLITMPSVGLLLVVSKTILEKKEKENRLNKLTLSGASLLDLVSCFFSFLFYYYFYYYS